MAALLGRYALLATLVLVVNFLLPRFLPGDPLDTSGEGLGSATSTLTAVAREQLTASYHLDQPLPAQFRLYMSDLAHGELGWSISRSMPVSQAIGERLPWTLGLVLVALLVSGALGAGLGVLAAWRGGWRQQVLITSSTALAGVPEFLVASSLLVVLAVGPGWFPLQGGRSPFGSSGPLDVAWHMALPVASLVLATTAPFLLITSGAMHGVVREPYLTTARAKGLSERRVALGHAAPNALLPILTLFGIRLGHALGGAIVVERVFAVPGLGLLAFEAIRARDYPLLQAVFLLGSLSVLIATLLLEMAYRHLDVRRSA